MRTMRLISSPLDGLPDAARDFLGRRALEVAGIVLVAVAVATGVALATWSVADPSINHATSGLVHNLLGYPGAVVSDVLMQMVGLASSAALMPVLLWGMRLLRRRGLAAPWPRIGLWIAGTLAAAGFASACPTSARWPLPTGLGGVAGDAILGLFATFNMAHGVGRLMIGGGLAVVAILALTASISVGGGASTPLATDEDEPVTGPSRGASRGRLDDLEDADAEPGLALLSAGALAHAFLSAKGAMARRMRGVPDARPGVGAVMPQREPSFQQSPPPGQTVPQPRRDGASRIQIHTQQPAPVSPAAMAAALAPRPSPMDLPGAKLAAEMLTRKASLLTHARRLARAVTGGADTAPGEQAPRIEPELPMAEAPSARRAPAVEERAVEERPRVAKRAVVEEEDDDTGPEEAPVKKRVANPSAPPKTGQRLAKEAQPKLFDSLSYQLPPLMLLSEPRRHAGPVVSEDALEQNARLLEGVLEDFGVRGEIMNVRPGPVVTLYELEPAPGTKSSRVISLADDVARSMSAVSARIAVVSGRNAIGIELPNQRRETVYLRELLASSDFESSKYRLPLCLGKTIGGEPVIAELARMPHLLIAGTTGSGKSVAINTMILSLLYRLKPEECRLIMVDPKMLELSVYDGIPHLLTPVVTDPKKAVVALKWAVREMEERYKRMSKLGVRNIDGYNARINEAKAKGEVINRTVQTGFDRETGEAVYEQEMMDLEALPFIVVIVDEMADLMMVAGKEIEGAVQRLAQMARAAGIHVILATQRPSVDVITGTIKANFPTRISFQVTSKIDSRTILGEQGAEQLLGQGDMLFMAGGGRISRVHGPFVSDAEVEKVVAHLKSQGRPEYLADVLAEDEEEAEAGEDGAVFDQGAFGAPSGDVYDQAVAVVLRDKKASTSYIQRRLQIGYNRAASLMERMEKEGIVGPANHAGKREILMESPASQRDDGMDEDEE
ncbi:DNA segregation ATPase FtsK/SpoIIIE, S-DNA-T family [Rhizobiales bacterium GAS188]|nr:DNA segregation ATPase FtsK/SpoIIIE, S-DNA-T family [Rhizobiales bacterium GAS188]